MAIVLTVESIPKRKTHNSLRNILKEFYESDADFGKFIYKDGEYVNARSCCNAIRVSAKGAGYPITACIRNGEVYIYKYKM